jgi:hypothetical protein
MDELTSSNEEIRTTRFRNLPSVNASQEELIVTVPDDKELLSSIRRRVQVSSEKIETGSLNVLSAKYEVQLNLR